MASGAIGSIVATHGVDNEVDLRLCPRHMGISRKDTHPKLAVLRIEHPQLQEPVSPIHFSKLETADVAQGDTVDGFVIVRRHHGRFIDRKYYLPLVPVPPGQYGEFIRVEVQLGGKEVIVGLELRPAKCLAEDASLIRRCSRILKRQAAGVRELGKTSPEDPYIRPGKIDGAA